MDKDFLLWLRRMGRNVIKVVGLVAIALILLPTKDAHAAEVVSKDHTAMAADGNTYTYAIYDDDTAGIYHCDAANPIVVIPEEIDGHAVSTLGVDGAGVGNRMFETSVTELTSLYFNTPYVNGWLFPGSSSYPFHVGEVTFGEDITFIEECLFRGASIDAVYFNSIHAEHTSFEGVIGRRFEYDTFPTTVGRFVIGPNVKLLTGHLLTAVVIEMDSLEINVEEIGNEVISGERVKIKNLTIGEDVKQLGELMTYNCTIDVLNYNATEADPPPMMVGVFGGKIGHLNIGDNVRTIPDGAFQRIELEQDGLTINAQKIGSRAFSSANVKIDTLNIGPSVEEIGYGVIEKAEIGTLNYGATNAYDIGGLSKFGGLYETDPLQKIDTVNVLENVEVFPGCVFEFCDIGTLNFEAANLMQDSYINMPFLKGSAVGQVNIKDGVTSIPAKLLNGATIGNTDLIIPESVTKIEHSWAGEVTADNLTALYVYANEAEQIGEYYTSLDYPNLFIHRGSGFYDYFTNTGGYSATVHTGMTTHILCDDHMGATDVDDNNGVTDGYRHRDCEVCGYEFEREYLLQLDTGEGITSVSGGGSYFAPGTEVTISCELENDYTFLTWQDMATSGELTADSTYTFIMGEKALGLKAIGKAPTPPDPTPTDPDSTKPDNPTEPTDDDTKGGDDQPKDNGPGAGPGNSTGPVVILPTTTPQDDEGEIEDEDNEDEGDDGEDSTDYEDSSNNSDGITDLLPFAFEPPNDDAVDSDRTSGNDTTDLENKDDGEDEDTDGDEDDAAADENASSGDDDGSGGDEVNGRENQTSKKRKLPFHPAIPLTAAGGTAGTGAFYFFWWSKRRKIRGSVIDAEGNPIEGMHLTISGKQEVETYTDLLGEFSFRRVKDDIIEFHAYDEDENPILYVQIATKEKDKDAAFTVVDQSVTDTTFDLQGKNLFVDITV